MKFKRVTPRRLISCVGDLEVERRCGYCRGCRRGVVAYDAWAGLGRDALTPRGCRMAVLAGSDNSYDKASDRLQRMCGIRVSDQTVRRACEKVGEKAKHYLSSAPEAGEALAQASGGVELSADGAKVNTTAGWREIRGVQASKRQPGEPTSVRHWKHRDLPRPEARLAWASIADAEQVGNQWRAWADQQGWRRGEGVSLLADGAAWIWKQARQHLPEHEGVVDIWHVMEHLNAAGRAMHGEASGGEQARRWAELQRALIFRHGHNRYLREHLAPQLREHRSADPRGEAIKALRSLMMYLWKHRGRMPYRDRLRRGLPIGSGQIEGLCKNTLNERLRKNSPRWRPENVDRMAALCCLHTSDQWDQFWRLAA